MSSSPSSSLTAPEPNSPLEATISILSSRISGLIGPSETELTKWKRVFETFAGIEEASGQR